jgi:hypothetical protein
MPEQYYGVLTWRIARWDRILGMVICYRLDGPGLEPRWEERDCLSSIPIQTLGPTQPPLLCETGSFPRVKWQGHGTDPPHLAPRLCMSRAIPLLTFWACIGILQDNLYSDPLFEVLIGRDNTYFQRQQASTHIRDNTQMVLWVCLANAWSIQKNVHYILRISMSAIFVSVKTLRRKHWNYLHTSGDYR